MHGLCAGGCPWACMPGNAWTMCGRMPVSLHALTRMCWKSMGPLACTC